MVILVDEIEAHLHPQWQRAILPAILDVTSVLSAQVEVQFLVVTHSPLVLASVETKFDAGKDKLFHLDIGRPGTGDSEAVLAEKPFCRYGETDRWLRSDIFELRQARSLEAEQAVEDARALQLRGEATRGEVKILSDRLLKVLPADDEFWPRWLYFARQHGVKL
jgi:hypothetical protein